MSIELWNREATKLKQNTLAADFSSYPNFKDRFYKLVQHVVLPTGRLQLLKLAF